MADCDPLLFLPVFWIILAALKTPNDILAIPPKFVFTPTLDNIIKTDLGAQHDPLLYQQHLSVVGVGPGGDGGLLFGGLCLLALQLSRNQLFDVPAPLDAHGAGGGRDRAVFQMFNAMEKGLGIPMRSTALGVFLLYALL
jgi:hypothetical protein